MKGSAFLVFNLFAFFDCHLCKKGAGEPRPREGTRPFGIFR